MNIEKLKSKDKIIIYRFVLQEMVALQIHHLFYQENQIKQKYVYMIVYFMPLNSLS